jgi:hypothetical protein
VPSTVSIPNNDKRWTKGSDAVRGLQPRSAFAVSERTVPYFIWNCDLEIPLSTRKGKIRGVWHSVAQKVMEPPQTHITNRS